MGSDILKRYSLVSVQWVVVELKLIWLTLVKWDFLVSFKKCLKITRIINRICTRSLFNNLVVMHYGISFEILQTSS